MGERVPLQDGLRARAGGRVPEGARVAPAIGMDSCWPRGTESVEAALPGPGVYRVEVRVPGWPVPWAISNPISVFDEATFAARDAAAAWPAPARAPGGDRGPRGPARLRGLQPGVRPDLVDGHRGRRPRPAAPRAEPALRLAFRLGAPTAGAALHLVRPREPPGARPLRLRRPALPRPRRRRLPGVGAGPGREPGLRRRRRGVVDGVGPHVAGVARGPAALLGLPHDQREDATASWTPTRCGASSSSSTTPPSSPAPRARSGSRTSACTGSGGHGVRSRFAASRGAGRRVVVASIPGAGQCNETDLTPSVVPSPFASRWGQAKSLRLSRDRRELEGVARRRVAERE